MTQQAIVEANTSNLHEGLAEMYELNWRTLVFEGRLGSGSFGDCFKGRKGGRPVAIKRMRSGLVDKGTFKAFCREVNMVSAAGLHGTQA